MKSTHSVSYLGVVSQCQKPSPQSLFIVTHRIYVTLMRFSHKTLMEFGYIQSWINAVGFRERWLAGLGPKKMYLTSGKDLGGRFFQGCAQKHQKMTHDTRYQANFCFLGDSLVVSPSTQTSSSSPCATFVVGKIVTMSAVQWLCVTGTLKPCASTLKVKRHLLCPHVSPSRTTQKLDR